MGNSWLQCSQLWKLLFKIKVLIKKNKKPFGFVAPRENSGACREDPEQFQFGAVVSTLGHANERHQQGCFVFSTFSNQTHFAFYELSFPWRVLRKREDKLDGRAAAMRASRSHLGSAFGSLEGSIMGVETLAAMTD